MNTQMPADSQDEASMEISLWQYIDGISSHTVAIEKLVSENARWKAKYSELLGIHSLINSADLEQPSMRFTKNVMEEIGRLQIAPAAKNYINQKIIWGIAAFFFIIIAGFFIYAIAQINWSVAGSSNSTFGFDLGNVDYTTVFNNSFVNLFMMINVILGLMFFDRFLQMKKQKMRQ